ncbi:unnamed protein product [Oikopleura dioica]|uniref:Uncharacterized protein n=1 Tax=Oikopleura dioica TaxID=34765 RepID=E4YNX8_OIKDI|nr:unnamed protein product [Oikopleura dioica]
MAWRWCLWRWRRKIGGIEFGGGVATERAVTGRLIETQIGGGAARPEHKHTTTQNGASRVATAHHCHGDINESPPSFLSVLIFAVGNFVVIAIRFRETTIRFRNFDFEEDKNNEALILQSERREIWNLIVSGVLLLTEIILSLAIYARIIDFGDDIRRQELVVLGEQIAYFFPVS